MSAEDYIITHNDWVPPPNSVLKLHIGDNEIRRISAEALIYENQLSYKRLVKRAVKYSDFKVDDDSSLKNFDVKCSYTDEDGDVISFSSNTEFVDAWKQLKGKVMRIWVTVQKKGSSATLSATSNVKSEETQVDESMMPGRKGRACGGRGRPFKMFHGRLSKLESQVNQLSQVMNLNFSSDSTNADAMDPEAAVISKAEEEVPKEDISKDIQVLKEVAKTFGENLMSAAVTIASEDGKKTSPVLKHYHIKCDGCTMSPIVGTRYKATNMQNYDLCEQCHADTKLPDVKFEAITLKSWLFNGTEEAVEKGEMFNRSDAQIGKDQACLSQLGDKIIHRGIQCDGCSMNPIVGDRYKATNMQDYDLCERCHTDTKIPDFKFEKIEHTSRRGCPHEYSKKTKAAVPMKEVEKKISEEVSNVIPSKLETRNNSVPKTVDEPENECKDIHRGIGCDGCAIFPIVGNRYRAINMPDYDLCELCHSDSKMPKDGQFEKIVLSVRKGCLTAKKNKSANLTAKRSPDFIHGRHTCDGCMKTPITGYRFQALNLPDYDLCADCFAKYNGDEIVFEAMELDRDRSRQAMWTTKISKGTSVKSFQERRDRASRNANAKKMEATLAVNVPLKKEKKDNTDISDVLGATLDQCVDVVSIFVNEVVDAVEKKPVSKIPVSSDSLKEKVADISAPHQDEQTDVSERDKGINATDGHCAEVVNAVVSEFVHALEHKPASTNSDPLVSNIKVEDSVTVEAEQSSLRSADSQSKVSNVVSLNSGDMIADDSLMKLIDAKIAMGDLTHASLISAESQSKDSSAVMVANGLTEVKDAEEVDRNFEVLSSVNSFGMSADQSLTKDDDTPMTKESEIKDEIEIIARYIKNLNLVSNDNTSSVSENSKPEIIPSPDSENSLSTDSVSVLENELSNVIISEGDVPVDDDKSEATADEWDILDDVAKQIESDEVLARAAQMCGSALFEESQKEPANKTASYWSTLSSLGSSLTSATASSAYVVPRWNKELKMLHELGFNDDLLSVDILERLTAANIGSGEMGAIKIEQVVDHILKSKA